MTSTGSKPLPSSPISNQGAARAVEPLRRREISRRAPAPAPGECSGSYWDGSSAVSGRAPRQSRSARHPTSHNENVDALPPTSRYCPRPARRAGRQPRAGNRRPPRASVCVRQTTGDDRKQPSTNATTSQRRYCTSWKVPSTNTNTALTMETRPSTAPPIQRIKRLMRHAPASCPDDSEYCQSAQQPV